MGFLQSLLHGREIQRLERLIATAPAPSVFLRLAQLYRDIGDEAKAEAAITKGAAMFPESSALKEARVDDERIRRDTEKQRIRAKLEQYPSPILYTKLAELHVEEEQYEEAHEVCRRGCRDYPDYGGLWTVLARIAIAQSNNDRAVEYLERATGLDQYNYEALMLLAETYLRKGDRQKGRHVLNQILQFAPGDERANKFLKDFDTRADEMEREAKALAEKQKKRTSFMEPVAGEGADAKPEPDRRKKSGSGVGTSLGKEIREIRRVEGVRGSVLIDNFGLVIASDLPDELDEELTAAHVTNLHRTVLNGAEQLHLGDLEDSIVDAEAGSIHILGLEDMTMGVLAAPSTKTGLLHRAIHIFAERVLDVHH